MSELIQGILRPLEEYPFGGGDSRTLGWYSAKGRKAHFLTLHPRGHATAACGVGAGSDMHGSGVPDDTGSRCKSCERALARNR